MNQAAIIRSTLALLLSAAPLAGAAGQEADGEAQATALTLELNALQPTDRGCRFTFLVENRLGAGLDSAAFEMAIFDGDGRISRFTVVDFKDLPDGKTKVRQFDFGQMDCTKIGRVLVNDSTECAGEGVEPRACMRALEPRSRVDNVVFGI
jgi:hypothetical protein